MATNGSFGDAAFSSAAVGKEDDSLGDRPADGVEDGPVFGSAPSALPPLSVPDSLAASVAIGTDGGDAAVAAGLGETVGLAGDDPTLWFERSHVAVAVVRSSPPTSTAPIASGRDDLLDSTGDSSYDNLNSAGRDSSRDVGSAERWSESVAAASLTSAMADAPGSTLGLTAGARTKMGSGKSTGFPRVAQKSSRFFRLVATKG